MNRIAGRTGIIVLLVLLLSAGILFFVFEFCGNADEWVIFSGSPHIYNGGNIGFGQVTDRAGVLLLDMRQGRTYSTDRTVRMSTVHWIGDRYGSIDAPALPNYAAEMAGFDLLTGIYSYGQEGGIAELTISARLQTAALEAMGDYKGALGIYNYKTGEILCAVSTPTYDPDSVPDLEGDTDGSFEGMYLNRFTQSLYIPGSIFKIVTLAAALEEDPDVLDQTFVCTGTYMIGADEIICVGAHWEQDLKQAFRNSCNCAFAQIAEKLGAETLERYVSQFMITESVSFDGIVTSSGNYDLENASAVNVAWSGIGQFTDQINPCRFMTFLGAIAAGGKGVVPYLVSTVSVDGTETYSADTQYEKRIMSGETAQTIQTFLENNVVTKYGAENFPGLTVCAKTGTGEVGGEKKPNAMLTGFVADEAYPYAFIVAVEDGGYGSEVCIPILSKVLAACKTYADLQH